MCSKQLTVTYTETDFDHLSWHDCHLWGLELRVGDPEKGDWTSDLAFDLDVIVAWSCGLGGRATFQVAPATLVFHGVTDLKLDVDWGRSGFRTALHPVSIHGLERERVQRQQVYLDRPCYRWRLRLNWPAGGDIVFGAVAFTQTLRAASISTERQYLSLSERHAGHQGE